MGGTTTLLQSTAVPLRPRERVWATGDRPTGALIVCKGAVTVSTFTAGGSQRVIGVSTRGVAIGIDDVIDGGSRRSEVEVVIPGTALYVRGTF